MEAAARVIGKRGFEAATVHEIARAAGVAAGTIYLYFRSKDEILDALVAELAADIDEDLQAARSRAGVAGFLARRAERLYEKRGLLRAVFAQALVDSKFAGLVRQQVIRPHAEAVQQLAGRRKSKREAIALAQAALWWAAGLGEALGEQVDRKKLLRAAARLVETK